MDAKPRHSKEQLTPMGLYQNFLGELVDLTNPALLPHLQDHQLYLTAVHELGYAIIYMNYIHPESGWTEQRPKVEALCEELRIANTYRKTDFQWWRGFIYRVQDETENMC